MKALDPVNVAQDAATIEGINNPNVITILTNLLEALEEFPDFQVENINPVKKSGYIKPVKTKCCSCTLEICYCFPCNGYQNAVWIKVHNINHRNIYYYIPFLKSQLKLKIFSDFDLNGNFPLNTHLVNGYYLPNNCHIPIVWNRPAYVTTLPANNHVFGSINDVINYSDLVNVICNTCQNLCVI